MNLLKKDSGSLVSIDFILYNLQVIEDQVLDSNATHPILLYLIGRNLNLQIMRREYVVL